MKVIVAGTRYITDMDAVAKALDSSCFEITEVVCGMARGVDLLGLKWAETFNVPVKKFPANWAKFGKRAGFLRNKEMAAYADALIAVWDGQSRGTKHMIEFARMKGLKIYVTDARGIERKSTSS